MKPIKTEKIVGYALIVVGLFFIIFPAALAISIFLTKAQIPTFISAPASNESDLATAVATLSNACLIFFFLAISVWAGSIISSRGVTMVKDVKLRLTRRSLKEAAETAEKLDV